MTEPLWIFFKAKRPGDDRTLDMFSDLIDKEVQHKGYTDKEGHYHAPHQQRHKVRAEQSHEQRQQQTAAAREAVAEKRRIARNYQRGKDLIGEQDRPVSQVLQGQDSRVIGTISNEGVSLRISLVRNRGRGTVSVHAKEPKGKPFVLTWVGDGSSFSHLLGAVFESLQDGAQIELDKGVVAPTTSGEEKSSLDTGIRAGATKGAQVPEKSQAKQPQAKAPEEPQTKSPNKEPDSADTGPKEGDTKTEGGVTYILRDGRWHRQEPEAPAAARAAGAPEAKPVAPAGSQDDLDPASPNYRYRDTGYVAGSRKEEAANLLRISKRTGQRVRATAVDWEELEKNPREAKEVITKSHLFGSVDWDALKAGGMEPGAGFLIDRVYAAVGTAPKDDTAQARKDYALGLESLRDRLEGCKTPDQVARVLDELRDEREGTALNAEETGKYAELTAEIQRVLQPQQEYEAEHRRLLAEASARLDILDRLKYSKQRGPEWATDLKAAEAENQKAWAAAEKFKDDNPQFQDKKRDLGQGWTAYDSDVEWEARKIRNARDLIVTGAKLRNAAENPLHRAWSQMGERFVAVINYRGHKGSETFRKQVATAKAGQVKDWSWAEKPGKAVAEPKGASEESTRFQLLVADKYERKGGRAVTVDSTEALKQTFGLREVQSGNWVLRDLNSAKFHVEHTAEAFADLADLIGAKDGQIAMNGRLALAFGARGRGNAGFGGAARAHYEAVDRIINLTKMGGGGSLAHEWFHAFDNLLQESFGKDSGKDTYLTEDPAQLPPGELRDAFTALRVALLNGSHRLARNVVYTAADVRQAKLNMDRQNEYGMPAPAKLIKQAGNVHAATKAVDAFYDAAIARGPASKRRAYEMRRKEWSRLAAAYYGANPAGGVIAVESGPAMSSFRHESTKLDQDQFGKYWSTPSELAARAFQAWCEDRLQGQGRRNDYLSAMADNRHYSGQKPFPEGEERTRINAAFDRLMDVVSRGDLLAKALGMRLPVLFRKARGWWGPEHGGTHVKRMVHEEGKDLGGQGGAGALVAALHRMRAIPIADGTIPAAEAEHIYRKLHHAEMSDGTSTQLVRGVFGKLAGHRDGDKILRLMPRLLDLMRSALPVYSEPERDPGKHPNIVAYHNYVSKAQLDGADYYVRFTVQEVRKLDGRELHNTALSDVQMTEAAVAEVHSGIIDPAKIGGSGLDKRLVQWLAAVKPVLRKSHAGAGAKLRRDGRDSTDPARSAHEGHISDQDHPDARLPNGTPAKLEKSMATPVRLLKSSATDARTAGSLLPILFFKATPAPPTKRRKRKVCLDADEFQREHERLLAVLRSPGHADDLEDAAEQAREMRGAHGH